MSSLQSGLRPSLRLNTRTKQEPILSQTLVLKSGGGQSYAYIDNRHDADINSVPETLFRYGLTDRVELRVGWNYEGGGSGNVVTANESSEGLFGRWIRAVRIAVVVGAIDPLPISVPVSVRESVLV